MNAGISPGALRTQNLSRSPGERPVVIKEWLETAKELGPA